MALAREEAEPTTVLHPNLHRSATKESIKKKEQNKEQQETSGDGIKEDRLLLHS